MTAFKCLCCSDTRIVIAADGTPRPCSRCCVDQFMAWADSRRPVPQPSTSLDEFRQAQER